MCAPEFWSAPNRGGFTIFEVLIVLALLVAAVGICWPQFERLHMEYRLRQAGQLVQARLAGARVYAIDSGFEYQFLFEPGGQRFLVLPHDPRALAALSAGASSAGANAAAGTHPPRRIAGRLPSPQAHFDPAVNGGMPGQPVPAEWLTGMQNASDFSGVNWSTPLLFRPDGTSLGGHVVIRDKKSQIVTVGVRGLTGAVSVSPIENGAPR